jgi:hypothetical protein
MTILTLLLPLEFPFRTTWSAKKFRGRAAEEVNAREPRPGSEELGAPTELQLDVVSEVARDAAWWRYAAMLVTLHGVGLALQCWGEACPCCDPDPQVRDRTRRAELELATGLSEEAAAPGPVAERCPLRGKRAPEMAAGQLFAVLQQICDAKLQDVLVSCSQAYLTPDQTASILQDFEFGKAQLRRALQQKLSFWSNLPWLLCGLAHFDEDVARDCARQAVALFDAAPPSSHHRVASRVLGHGLDLRREVDEFIAGKPLDDLPALQDEVYPKAFITIVERRGEALHSELHKALAGRRTGGSYASVALRMPEMRDCARPSTYEQFAQHIREVRNPKRAAMLLNLGAHPDLKPMLAKSVPHGNLESTLP